MLDRGPEWRLSSATERSGRLARFQAKSRPGAIHSHNNFAHTTTGLHQSTGIGGPVQRELRMDQGAQAAIGHQRQGDFGKALDHRALFGGRARFHHRALQTQMIVQQLVERKCGIRLCVRSSPISGNPSGRIGPEEDQAQCPIVCLPKATAGFDVAPAGPQHRLTAWNARTLSGTWRSGTDATASVSVASQLLSRSLPSSTRLHSSWDFAIVVFQWPLELRLPDKRRGTIKR